MAVDNLSTLAKVKVYMKITGTDDDALLTVLLAQASKIIEEFTGRKFLAQDYVDQKHDGDGEQILYPRQYPVNSIAAIIKYEPQTDTDLYTFTANTEYIIHDEKEYIIMWGRWTPGTQNFKISYNAGFSPIPEDIELACNMLVSYTFDDIRKQAIKAYKVGTYSQTNWSKIDSIMPAMTPQVIGILNIWRRPVI